jgi:Protein of unknown function (DUF3467)
MTERTSQSFPLPENQPMADEMKIPLDPQPSAPAGANPQTANIRIPVNMASITTNYANFFRVVTGTVEEVMIDFGLHTGVVAQGNAEPINVTQRVVMSLPAAKRLLETLARSIAQHEQLFGPVETDPQRRLRQQPGRS